MEPVVVPELADPQALAAAAAAADAAAAALAAEVPPPAVLPPAALAPAPLAPAPGVEPQAIYVLSKADFDHYYSETPAGRNGGGRTKKAVCVAADDASALCPSVQKPTEANIAFPSTHASTLPTHIWRRHAELYCNATSE